IPRDFFNEAKLLKSMGLLALKVLDHMTPEGVTIEIEDSGDPFEVDLLEDGSLTVSNYRVTVNDVEVTMKTTYNSKANYPLMCEYDLCEYMVFDDAGEFTEEFKELAATLAN